MGEPYISVGGPVDKPIREYGEEDPAMKGPVFFTNKRVLQPEPARKSFGPEKRARFERTQEILAKSGLLDITKKTAVLIKSNQQAQADLQQLRQEINDFVQSVLANPENKGISLTTKDSFASNPLNLDRIQQAPVPVPAKPTQVSVIKSHQSAAAAFPKYTPAEASPYTTPGYGISPATPYQSFVGDISGGRAGYHQTDDLADTPAVPQQFGGPAQQLYHLPPASFSD